jgi:L-aspartate oxidase
MNLHDFNGQPVIIGAGIAGLMTALRLAPHPVILLSEASLGAQASSTLAQGGLAASLGEDDSTDRHLADTLAAGDGLSDLVVARRIIEAAPSAVEELARLGVRFDRAANGAPRLGLEAAHGRRRVAHAAGDGTGREIMRALVEAVRRTPSIRVLEGVSARRLIVRDDAIAGVVAAGSSGAAILATQRVVIATGGIGGLFRDTSNPMRCFGHGLVLAAYAGAMFADLEFIQFHPTALDVPARPMPLISEAVRGEGALLVNERGERFMANEPGAELAPRDVVARAVWRQLLSGNRVFLDARASLGERFATRFPAVTANCRKHGYDPVTQPVPVRPAAHYHMGGIAVDGAGRSSVVGLWACGEAACTGLHGANRLASNSLMEAVVCAGWVAHDVAGMPAVRSRTPRIRHTPPASDATRVQPILSRAAGVLRNEEELRKAVSALLPLAAFGGASSEPALIALMIATAALRRKESRGAHSRTDYPSPAATAERSFLSLDEALSEAREFDSPRTVFDMEARA